MTIRVMISGDKWGGFTWQLVENDNVLQSGVEMTEPKAVVAGQDALIEHVRSQPPDRWWKRSEAIPIDKLTSQNDT